MILLKGEWICPQCKVDDGKKETSKTSPSKSHSSPTKALTLKGPFTKSPPVKTNHSGNVASPGKRGCTSLEKRLIFESSDQTISESDNFVDIWEFKDETSDTERTPKKNRSSECSTSPEKTLVKVDERKNQVGEMKTTPIHKKGLFFIFTILHVSHKEIVMTVMLYVFLRNFFYIQ